MNVALLQFAPAWENPQENLTKMGSMLQGLHPDVDLVILPEMFNTGFSMNANSQAEKMDGETMSWMLEHSANYTLVGSLMIEENNRFYNRLVVVKAGKLIGQYDKRKLFGMAQEDRVFTPGNSGLTLSLNNFTFSFFICYDLRFPEVLRNTNDYDIAVIVASWPEKRIEHWNALLKARAIENQAYVLACNRVGTDANDIKYNGCSQIIEPDGEILIKTENTENVLYAKLNRAKIDQTRTKLPFLKDR